MRRVTLKGPLAGGLLEVLGYLTLLFGIRAILDGADITNRLMFTLTALCPASLIHGVRNAWAVFAINCAIYASVLSALNLLGFGYALNSE